MKATAVYLILATIFALVGGVILKAGFLDRDLARVEEQLVASDYEQVQPVLDDAERFYGYASRLPWVGSRPLTEVRTRKAAVQYWQGNYSALMTGNDPLARASQDGAEYQFLVATAMYRDSLRRAEDRATMIEALDTGIAGYLAVLKTAPQHRAAAYNYEYLVRVRDELDKNRRKPVPPKDPDSQHGMAGRTEERGDTSKFKTYVPHDSKELEKNPNAEAGKSAPIKKKG